MRNVGKKEETGNDFDAAGVSRVAVYAAMNPEKKTTVSLSGKTREKILSAAKELGYVPNDMGRTLVSGRSRNVGLLLQ